MSNIFYDKYTDKSLIVRGSSLEAKKFRNKLREQMEGVCKWLTAVKDNKGPGLLIPDSEKNRKTLDCYTQMTQILKNDVATDIKSCDINQNVVSNDVGIAAPTATDDLKKEVCTQTTIDDETNNTKKNCETCTKRNENTNIKMNASPRLRSNRREDPTPHRANDYYRKQSKSQQTPEYISESEDNSDDASINSINEIASERIRKLGKMKRRRGTVEELQNRDEIDENEPVDSEDEDIVTLSRRIRYILRCTNVLRTNIENVDERVEKVERKMRRYLR